MNTGPIIIRKSAVGLYRIWLTGVLAILGLAFAGYTYRVMSGNYLTPVEFGVLAFLIVLIAAVTLAVGFVYQSSYIAIAGNVLRVHNQISLFAAQDAELQFNEVQDVSYRTVGIFSSLLNYGTLLVQTAGTQDEFYFTYCPKPAYVRDLILERTGKLSTGL